MLKRMTAAAAVAMALHGSAAMAADSKLADIFSVRGYGTFGLTHSDEDQADFIAKNVQPQGAGFTNSWSPDVDSKLALQVNAQFTSKLSAVVQLISESAYNSTWDGDPNARYHPSLEWANIKYQFNDQWSVRIGRSVLPINMISEYRNVGYANTFVRPPVETYGAVPFTNIDGGDISFKKPISGGINTLTVSAGAQSLRAGIVLQSPMYVMTDTFENGDLTVRVAYMHSPFDSPTGFGTLFTSFIDAANALPGGTGTAAAAQGQDLYDRYDYQHTLKINHYDLGAIYDPGKWFVMGELYRFENNGFVGNASTGFVTVGFRQAKFTPYATFSKAKSSHHHETPIDVTGLPVPLAIQGSIISGLVQSFASANTSQETLSAGVRWDVYKNTDIKVQYDHISLDDGSNGRFANLQPGFQPGGSANILSLTFDFVF
jgi:hypothetical protein